MSDTDEAAPRRYSEEEIERILKRAAELDRERPTTSADASGMTLAELEQIGSEAGLRPEHLRRAARELDRPPRSSAETVPWLGAPVVIRFEWEGPGEMDERGLETLVPEIRRVADGAGHPVVMGRTLSWESSDPGQSRTLGVTVTSRNGHTRIWIEERLHRLAGGLFGGLVGGFGGGVGLGMGLGVGLGALGSAAFAATFPVAILGGSYLMARGLYRGRYEARHEDLARLRERLVTLVEGSRILPEAGRSRGGALPPD